MAERGHVSSYLGSGRAAQLDEQAKDWYKKLFTDSRLVSGSYWWLLPDRSKPTHGMGNLAPWLFTWVEARLDTFWWVIYQAVFRVQLLLQWLTYLLPLLLAALIDGVIQRQVKKRSHGYANPVRYHAAWHAITALFVVPPLYLSTPFSLHPIVIPAWAVLLSLAVVALFANIQQRL